MLDASWPLIRLCKNLGIDSLSTLKWLTAKIEVYHGAYVGSLDNRYRVPSHITWVRLLDFVDLWRRRRGLPRGCHRGRMHLQSGLVM